jgi:predicted transcriptional regulator
MNKHYDYKVRTTVTLDDDVAARIKELAHKRRASFKATLNETLRRGLSAQERTGAVPRFEVEPHAGGFRPGVDQGKLNQLLDALETDDLSREAQRG